VHSIRGVIGREADDVASGVDALWGGISRSRHVSRCECPRECNRRDTKDKKRYKKRCEDGSLTHGDPSLSKASEPSVLTLDS
jgi:hypothetical protein